MLKKTASLCFFSLTLISASRASATGLFLGAIKDEAELSQSFSFLSFDALLIMGMVVWVLYLSLFPKGGFLLPFLKKRR